MRALATFDTDVLARAFAVEQHRRWLTDDTFGAQFPKLAGDRPWILEHLHLLEGKDLACWCPTPEPGEPDHCHGAVLLDLANRPD